jgi:hypothetical protein
MEGIQMTETTTITATNKAANDVIRQMRLDGWRLTVLLNVPGGVELTFERELVEAKSGGGGGHELS